MNLRERLFGKGYRMGGFEAPDSAKVQRKPVPKPPLPRPISRPARPTDLGCTHARIALAAAWRLGF